MCKKKKIKKRQGPRFFNIYMESAKHAVWGKRHNVGARRRICPKACQLWISNIQLQLVFLRGGGQRSKRQDIVLAPFAMGCRYTGATLNAEACNRVADPLEFSLQGQFGSPRCKKCNRIRRCRTSRRERASIQRARKSTSGGGWRWLGGLITGFPTRFEWGKQPVVTVLGKQSF